MEPRLKRDETAGRNRSRSLPKVAADLVTIGAQLQWVAARVPFELVREIEAHAKRSGTIRSGAIRECLAVGIETIRNAMASPADGSRSSSERSRASVSSSSSSARRPSEPSCLQAGGEGGIRTPGTGFIPVQQISNRFRGLFQESARALTAFR
jgi:hypothetical protein